VPVSKRLPQVVVPIAILLACGAGWFLWSRPEPPATVPSAVVDEHAGHDHARDPDSSITLSDQARENLGLELAKVSLIDYWRSLSIPAEVVEEPGHCEQRITTSLDGFVRKIYILKGQTVYPGDPLFELQLAGGPLADVQASLLRTVQNRELVTAELERIKPLADQGTIPIRTLLEKQSELKRLEIQQHTEREELLIRGLTDEQVREIMESKTLLRTFTVRVQNPPHLDHAPDEDHPPAAAKVDIKPAALTDYPEHPHGDVYTVEKIDVVQGELVRAGDRLGDLALHTMLLIEGRAFEREASNVERVMANKWPVSAHFETGDSQPLVRSGLTVLSIENSLDAAGRTLKFYLPFANEVFLDRQVSPGVSYRNWRFRPGQKVRLQLPVEHLEKKIVIPNDAVVREGADAFVFRVNGRKLERVPVVIAHQDMTHSVLGRGSKITDGDMIAMNQAYQLNLILKQASAPQSHGHDHAH